MLKAVKSTVVAAGLALAAVGMAHAAPLSAFDARATDNWAEKLVLCDTTAFLATSPDLNSDLIYVRHDDARRFDMLLPPTFVGAGRWYKDGYEQLYWRLRAEHKVDAKQLFAVQDSISRPFVAAYRHNGRYNNADAHFLRAQDSYCRALARENGSIVS